ncbi:site-specific integrase [Halomonas sp. 25-S5]|uniref:site-specific integrase n=1 Tax=Halomonas sp. 25-S5 TaxID=2994065 RepID=UPI002468ACA2|nr:site-specific integrase [Halomonas sp. 25-S5]
MYTKVILRGILMAYLLKSRHGVWYFRYQVPESNRQDIGKREIRQSLGTKSYREANRRLPKVFIEVMESLKLDTENTPINRTPIITVFFEDYVRHLTLEGIRPKSIIDKRVILKTLVSVVGDKRIDEITLDDAKRFKQEALKMDKVRGKGKVSISTVNNWLRNTSAMFDYALKEQLIPDNHFKGLAIKQRVNVASLRDAFNPSEVNTIIDYLEDNKGTLREEQYWVILIGAYSGLRLNEVCQMYVSDVIEYQDVWCFNITSDREDQNVKNLSSERLVPIHQHLLDKGILTYVGSKKERLFPNLKYTNTNGYRGGISKWFSTLLRNIGIKTPNNKVSYYSFRHFVATELKHKMVEEHVTAQLLGHSSGSISYSRYGKRFDVKTLKEVIDLVNT